MLYIALILHHGFSRPTQYRIKRIASGMVAMLMFIFGLIVMVGSGVAETDKNEILAITIADPISPAMAEFVADALVRASNTNAACIVISLDTPGGLVESTRKMVQAI
jgi:membrane-bound serine protease (ClpP class)